MQAGLVNLLQTVRSTGQRKTGLWETWTACLLLLWVVIAICWSL